MNTIPIGIKIIDAAKAAFWPLLSLPPMSQNLTQQSIANSIKNKNIPNTVLKAHAISI